MSTPTPPRPRSTIGTTLVVLFTVVVLVPAGIGAFVLLLATTNRHPAFGWFLIALIVVAVIALIRNRRQ
jgi:hypothetical protein